MLDALAEFAAGAGHELNNPLAVIVGRAQLLMAREDDPEAVRSFRAIIAQAQRAHRILRDLMYVARPPEPRPRPCQPEEIVRACLRDLQAEAEARGVRIVAEAREPASRVWADPDPLRQLADILARNALEATPSGGSVLFTAGDDGRTLRWSVHDTGRGIGATEGLHLFDPFYCGRQAGRGLGLGLPRAARIVEQAGGDLRWQSVPGHGTTFQVVAPGRGNSPGPGRRTARRVEDPPGLAGSLGSDCPRIHRVGDLVAVAAEEGHVQGFVVIPVVPFQSLATAAPGTALGPLDQPELLGQGGGVSGRPRPDPAGSEQVGADLQVAAKTGELGVLTVPANLFHGTLPECDPEASPSDAWHGGSQSLGGVRHGSIR